jgi:hypothetical protein
LHGKFVPLKLGEAWFSTVLKTVKKTGFGPFRCQPVDGYELNAILVCQCSKLSVVACQRILEERGAFRSYPLLLFGFFPLDDFDNWVFLWAASIEMGAAILSSRRKAAWIQVLFMGRSPG